MMNVTEQEIAAAELEAREWGGAYRPVFLAHITRLDEIMDDCRVMAVAKLEDAYWGAVRAWVDRALVFAADPAATSRRRVSRSCSSGHLGSLSLENSQPGWRGERHHHAARRLRGRGSKVGSQARERQPGRSLIPIRVPERT